MFRALMFIGALGMVAFMAGWFTIDRSAEETTIRFNRDEIRADTSKAFAKGRELIDKGREATGRQDQQQSQPFAGAPPFGSYQQPAQSEPQFGAQNSGSQQPANFQTPNGYSAPQQATLPQQPWDTTTPRSPQY